MERRRAARFDAPELVIVDDDPVFVRSLAWALEADVPLSVHPSVRSVEQRLRTRRPMCALVTGASLPDGDATSILESARRSDPTLPMLVTLAAGSDRLMNALYLSGATCCLARSTPDETERVVRVLLCRSVRRLDRLRLAARRAELSPRALSERQAEVVARVAGGARVEQVADDLGISARTVKTHLERACAATGAPTRAHLMGRVRAVAGTLFGPADLCIEPGTPVGQPGRHLVRVRPCNEERGDLGAEPLEQPPGGVQPPSRRPVARRIRPRG